MAPNDVASFSDGIVISGTFYVYDKDRNGLSLVFYIVSLLIYRSSTAVVRQLYDMIFDPAR